jgi:hypothetical protein
MNGPFYNAAAGSNQAALRNGRETSGSAKTRSVSLVHELYLLFPCPLSSETEERGMKYGGGQPGVALADSLTPGYFLKPLRGF